MSAFDEWWEEIDLTPSLATNALHSVAHSAWNAALDQLEVLAEGWKESDQGDPLGQGKCAEELLARIKELRT